MHKLYYYFTIVLDHKNNRFIIFRRKNVTLRSLEIALTIRLRHFSECLRHWPSRGDIVISRTKTGNLQVKSPSGRTHVCVNEHRHTFDCKWK